MIQYKTGEGGGLGHICLSYNAAFPHAQQLYMH